MDEELPKLPVPDLRQTLVRYLAGLRAVVPAAQWSESRRLAEEFAEGEGRSLQTELLDLAGRVDNWECPICGGKISRKRDIPRHMKIHSGDGASTSNTFDQELKDQQKVTSNSANATRFWLDDMYLGNPIPLPVNSNPFFLLPKQHFHSSADQHRFASKVVLFALEYKKKIDNNELPPDTLPSRGGKPRPMCMKTYKNFFPAYRRPGEQKDQLVMSTKQGKDDAWNIIVACKHQLFSVQVKPPNSEDCFSEEILAEQLKLVAQMAKDKENVQPPVGLLTTENRRTWAKLRNRMLKKEVNSLSLEVIESSLLVLCLDDGIPNVPSYSTIRKEATTLECATMAAHLLHGSGTDAGSANRWYDKFLQAIVTRDGVAGFVVEHSASEGITVLRFCEEFLQHLSTEDHCSAPERTASPCPPVMLNWDIDDETFRGIQEASKKMNKLCNDLDFFIHRFSKYGKEFIKSHKISPDAFIQVALQLTYYKVHRKLVSTYESASLRRFRDGRVDNIRAATAETLTWVKAMCDEQQVSEEEKVQLFQACIKKHSEIMKYTVGGEGPDNHLLALKELGRCNGSPEHPLFLDKSYWEYLNFRLSTSQLPTTYGILVGYGPVVPDGYGCSYNPCSDHIDFCVSSFFSSQETSSDFFAHSLEGSLLHMGEICLKMRQMEEEATTQDNSGGQTRAE